jgi:endonuclease YncB( thermonuclease family)
MKTNRNDQSEKIKFSKALLRLFGVLVLLFVVVNIFGCNQSNPVPTIEQVQPILTSVSNLLAPTNIPTTQIPTVLPSQTLSPGADFPCIPQQLGEVGTVMEVTDGDTIKVKINNVLYPVRYIGVDTPETYFSPEPLGKEAKRLNASMVTGKIIWLYKDVNNVDKFDRLLRYVIADGKFINDELVRSGVAESKDYPPDTACSGFFHQTQKNAQVARVGMWSGMYPTQTPNALPMAIIPENSSNQGALSIITVNKKAEVVTIQNNGGTSINLVGWVLLSVKGGQRCNLSGTIASGATLQIWTERGVGVSCGLPSSIWNNSEVDPAVLLDPAGNEVARFSS